MKYTTQIESQINHIKNECDSIKETSDKVLSAVESIGDACESILENVQGMVSHHESEMSTQLRDNSRLEDEISDWENRGTQLPFSTNYSVEFQSMAGNIIGYADNLLDLQLLQAFEKAASTIRTADLIVKLEALLK